MAGDREAGLDRLSLRLKRRTIELRILAGGRWTPRARVIAADARLLEALRPAAVAIDQAGEGSR